MRIALDTNVLAYAAGVNGAERQRAALQLLDKLSESIEELYLKTRNLQGPCCEVKLRDMNIRVAAQTEPSIRHKWFVSSS